MLKEGELKEEEEGRVVVLEDVGYCCGCSFGPSGYYNEEEATEEEAGKSSTTTAGSDDDDDTKNNNNNNIIDWSAFDQKRRESIEANKRSTTTTATTTEETMMADEAVDVVTPIQDPLLQKLKAKGRNVQRIRHRRASGAIGFHQP